MKRIITCSDGTWNKPDSMDRGKLVQTNVERIHNCICDAEKQPDGSRIEQKKVYGLGVGTGYTLRDKVLGGATGAGIDKNIQNMYTFICLNYEPDDQIYMFGFSRGAYTARSLAGFIRNCGILKPACIHLVPKAYELYRDRNKYTHPDSDLMKSFRKQYCIEDDTIIHFIGVWDTVGSLGIPLPSWKFRNLEKYRFHDQTLNKYVRNAYHAIAIDERRKLFEPTYWMKVEEQKESVKHIQNFEQRWFSGVHSNVGGGYSDTGLSNIALKWLVDKAHEAGLCYTDELFEAIKGNIEGELRNSYTYLYWFWRPRWRTIDLQNKALNMTIDDSVRERYKSKKYQPRNLLRLAKAKLFP